MLCAGWLVTLIAWRFARGDLRLALYGATDAAQALIFFYMSRGRWFPVPLFFLYATQVLYHSYTALIGAGPVWVAAFLNRTFEIALIYVMACAIFRLLRLRRKAKGLAGKASAARSGRP